MLRRFCLILQLQFGFTDEVPEETNKLVTAFQQFLQQVPAEARVVLVIDAVNQLDETDNAQQMHWLPRELPPQVKVVISCIDATTKDTKESTKSTKETEGEKSSVLEAFEQRPHKRLTVDPLTDAERLEIVRKVPSLSAKTLDAIQVGLLLANPATRNPLFLLVALEELRGFGSFELLDRRIAELPRPAEDSPHLEQWLAQARAAAQHDPRQLQRLEQLADALRDATPVSDPLTMLFQQVSERLEEDFNPALVRHLLSYLACARIGLSELELQELLTRNPQSVISNPQSEFANPKADDLFPALRQLRPYLQYRDQLLTSITATCSRRCANGTCMKNRRHWQFTASCTATISSPAPGEPIRKRNGK